jgi:hypothetical protein
MDAALAAESWPAVTEESLKPYHGVVAEAVDPLNRPRRPSRQRSTRTNFMPLISADQADCGLVIIRRRSG